jgi:hypothetical protein
MGYYISTDRNTGKADYLIATEGAHELLHPLTDLTYEEATAQGKAVIAVVSNGLFEAAGFAFSLDEFRVFTDPRELNSRPVRYLLMDRERAELLSGYSRKETANGN